MRVIRSQARRDVRRARFLGDEGQRCRTDSGEVRTAWVGFSGLGVANWTGCSSSTTPPPSTCAPPTRSRALRRDQSVHQGPQRPGSCTGSLAMALKLMEFAQARWGRSTHPTSSPSSVSWLSGPTSGPNRRQLESPTVCRRMSRRRRTSQARILECGGYRASMRWPRSLRNRAASLPLIKRWSKASPT